MRTPNELYNGMGTSAAWTPERRAKQSEVIRRVKPWTKSTGPTSEAGKARSSQNAYKGGWRAFERASARRARAVARVLQIQAHLLGHDPLSDNEPTWRQRARTLAAVERDFFRLGEAQGLVEELMQEFLDEH
ncbi:hypothetical protein SCH01S_28_00830 [Sphingomonas changbaiensis NBRC 104936]|uniref:Uncharacterized protein n=1 Tax=Sphingomonas changbaiensis NBRC 104936 TaxID=1219043 RepID=A0A0E9MNU6_9SPHN|nr:hypothetical protein SCH01S_28_00830 [Sphingomonas changbaiensis NBRC 104936]